MTRHFTLRTVLRMTPTDLLQEFFTAIGHRPLSIDWKRLKKSQTDGLLLAISWLSEEAQGQIQSALASVFELACTSGTQAILEAARANGSTALPLGFPQSGNPYCQAMWSWLHCPQLFDQAARMRQVENLTRWRKRNGLPHIDPRTTPQTLQDFAAALSNFLRQTEGRGHRCTVEHFQRTDGTDYFVVYPDDFVRCVLMHDEHGRLVSRSLKRTFEIVFAYDRDDGILELHANSMASDLKPKLERLFGEIILNSDLGPVEDRYAYDLNRLKDRCFVLDTDPEDGIAVAISRLQLAALKRAKLTVEPMRNSVYRDIYDAVDAWLNPDEFSWKSLNISMATLRFQFLPLAQRRRAGTADVTITWPDGCSVRTRDPERLDLIRKYLKRWRIGRV